MLEDRHLTEMLSRWDMRNFDEEAHYADSGVDDSVSQAARLHFEDSFQHRGQYYLFDGRMDIEGYFRIIADNSTRDKGSIAVYAGSGTRIETIYRARIFQSADKLEKYLYPDKAIACVAFQDRP